MLILGGDRLVEILLCPIVLSSVEREREREREREERERERKREKLSERGKRASHQKVVIELADSLVQAIHQLLCVSAAVVEANVDERHLFVYPKDQRTQYVALSHLS